MCRNNNKVQCTYDIHIKEDDITYNILITELVIEPIRSLILDSTGLIGSTASPIIKLNK